MPHFLVDKLQEVLIYIEHLAMKSFAHKTENSFHNYSLINVSQKSSLKNVLKRIEMLKLGRELTLKSIWKERSSFGLQ